MKIVVDENIPYIRTALERISDQVAYINGKSFSPQIIRDADALIIRTLTRCNRALLEGSRVQFIATATIGYDHIDIDYCKEAGISWTNCPGCNASSVAQYVESTLLLEARRRKQPLSRLTMGVIGVGHVGSKVADVARHYGMHVRLCDPPRAESEGAAAFTDIETVAAESDIISLHVPLTYTGKYATHHLANQALFVRCTRKPLFINTSRGEVADTQAILHALDSGQIGEAAIDVWEHEPTINRELLSKAWIATPHIAGYSADGKANATRMSLESLCRHFRISTDFQILPPEPASPIIRAASETDALLSIYNPMTDSERLKSQPEDFESLRANYPLRREKTAYVFR
ncbi:MAG: 4-phosphoerythronate dehydrogenase PdxB [Prevotellaceae bacterium]|jgi:erythronate-4-phosphate dehydrogenase|nr:4-phosphoerythronate dehydrogenase PdxB [Prevotellaceae bacterium]